MSRDQVLRWGGVASGAVLVAFGLVVVVLAINGHKTVTDELNQQQITGTPDMTPQGIKAAVAGQSWANDVTLPTCSVAGQSADTGGEARCFAQYMRIHALEATGGLVYSQMGQFTAKPDTPKSELTPTARRATRNTQSPTRRRTRRSRIPPGTSGSPRPLSRPR
jgi:hypothetical protein